MRLAAIDIGSNAARLLITEVVDNGNGKPQFNKLNLVRVPLRLGFDVFELGEISKSRRHMIMETMKAYAHLMKAYEVEHFRACATSAMRDAKNNIDIIRKVKLETHRTGGRQYRHDRPPAAGHGRTSLPSRSRSARERLRRNSNGGRLYRHQ